MTLGYDARGKRITRKASGKTKTEAKGKLKELVRDLDDGLAVASGGYTVADAVRNWLEFGLRTRDEQTVATLTSLANNHVIPGLGALHLRELSADDVDKGLEQESKRQGQARPPIEGADAGAGRGGTRGRRRDTDARLRRGVLADRGTNGRNARASLGSRGR